MNDTSTGVESPDILASPLLPVVEEQCSNAGCWDADFDGYGSTTYRHNHNIMVVGDDAQAIYGFRAATVRNILDFPKEFPHCKTVTLTQNYRSVGPILESTNRVIAYAKERYTKDLWSERKGEQKPFLVRAFCMDSINGKT